MNTSPCPEWLSVSQWCFSLWRGHAAVYSQSQEQGMFSSGQALDMWQETSSRSLGRCWSSQRRRLCMKVWWMPADIIERLVIMVCRHGHEDEWMKRRRIGSISTKTIGEYLYANTFCLVRHWSTTGPETKRIAAWNGADWYRSCVEETLSLFCMVFVSWIQHLVKKIPRNILAIDIKIHSSWWDLS